MLRRRLPEGPYLGLAALTHHSHEGVDERGPIGSGMATALSNPGFSPRTPNAA
ncbi:hypothetical protein [Mycobacterium sp. URHB0021]